MNKFEQLGLNESLLKAILDLGFENPSEVQEKPEQKFEKRAVKVGLSDGIKIEIKEGLAENEKVRGAIVDPNKK
jgi:hypothetical protein